MKRTNNNTLAIAITTLGMIGTSSATVIFDASPTNTTQINNGIAGTPGSLTGTPGNLTYTNGGGNFDFSGFTSTNDVNTLNGTDIVSTDVVTATINVSSFSGAELRANGIDFGFNNDTALGTESVGDLQVRLNATNLSGAIQTFFNGGDALNSGSNTNVAQLTDGFTATLVADVNGYTFTIDGATASPLVIDGTFSGTEFVDTIGNAHFTFSQQHRNNDQAASPGDLSSLIAEASIEVVSIPEPSSTALLGLGGLALIMRRRK